MNFLYNFAPLVLGVICKSAISAFHPIGSGVRTALVSSLNLAETEFVNSLWSSKDTVSAEILSKVLRAG
jgi:hypothetical protein